MLFNDWNISQMERGISANECHVGEKQPLNRARPATLPKLDRNSPASKQGPKLDMAMGIETG